ncbi:MAG: trigger factor [Clostridiales bacterium]|jgi:trigger factor|nr:trigger factor [Clostridiales bacterium]
MAILEKLEANKAKLTFDISKEKIEEGTKQAYNKNKSRFNIPGFRKGKAPRVIIEAQFGKNVFFEDAINYCIPPALSEAYKEHGLDVVSRPELEIDGISEDGVVTVSAVVFTKPVVDPVDYIGIRYPKIEVSVSDDEIDAVIEKEREQNSRIVIVEDRPVIDKDIVTIDFEGFMDGVPFEGGSGEGYELAIGSNSFIDNFEGQLIGHSIGETVVVNVNFPEGYQEESLSGKPAQFNVTINEIKYKELPDVDDDFAQDVSEFENLAQYKGSIKETLLKQKQKDAETEKENKVMDALIEKNNIDIPEVMIENQIDNIMGQFEDRLSAQGLDLQTYLHYIGKDMDAYRGEQRDYARKQISSMLILEAIGEKENIEITDTDKDEELEKAAKHYSVDVDKFKSSLRDNDLKNMADELKVRKSLKFVLDSAIEE